jgi:hypothetical protein
VLDAGLDESPQMVVRQAVVDRTTFSRGFQHGAVAEQPQLVANGRYGEAGVFGDLGDVEAVSLRESVHDPNPGVIGDG